MADEGTGFLKNVISAFSLVIAWTFATGWTYLHAFYSFFGINISSLDFPVYQYLIFCYTQFLTSAWSAIGMSLLIIAFFVLTWLGVAVSQLKWALAVCLAYLLLFGGGFLIAVHNARTAAIRYMLPDSPLPEITLDTGNLNFKSGDIEQELGSSRLRLLLETKDQLFVFRTVPLGQQKVKLHVITLDRNSIAASLRTTTVNIPKVNIPR